jgi:prepilin-type N-terminal cleavage/methylation domain-containing protein
MKKNIHGFTLVELLVVLAIIGILAGMVFPALKGGIQKAQDEKCRTNLKQLHTACISYANDHGGNLPYAQSFEIFNSRSRRFEERRGWISWSPSDLDIDTLNSQWSGSNGEKSQSDKLTHDRGFGPEARFGVEHGVIFEYMNESMEHYVCPASVKIAFGKKAAPTNKDSGIYRTYAMNEFFYAPHYPSPWHNRNLTRIGTDENFPYGDEATKKSFTPEASKLLLFSEIIIPGYDHNKGKFNPGRTQDNACRHGDCILVAWKKTGYDATKEDVIMPIHQRKTQKDINSNGVIDFGFAYCVFVDGHIEQLQQSFLIGSEQYNTLWFLIRGIDPQNTKDLGKGISDK